MVVHLGHRNSSESRNGYVVPGKRKARQGRAGNGSVSVGLVLATPWFNDCLNAF